MLVTEGQYGIKNYSAGENAARKALEIDPNKASAHYILGRSLEGQGRDCEALGAYRTALDGGKNMSNPGFNVTVLSRAVDKMASRVRCWGD
jgi:Flp pilus assembly protein TadD